MSHLEFYLTFYMEQLKSSKFRRFLIKPSSGDYLRREVAIAEVISGDLSKLVGRP